MRECEIYQQLFIIRMKLKTRSVMQRGNQGCHSALPSWSERLLGGLKWVFHIPPPSSLLVHCNRLLALVEHYYTANQGRSAAHYWLPIQTLIYCETSRSAGLPLPEQCHHWLGESNLWISLILFYTNGCQGHRSSIESLQIQYSKLFNFKWY